MADAAGGVDTSSYPKLPATPPNFLDTASKLQTLQSGAIQNQQQQLTLIQQRFKAVAGQIPGLLAKPDLNQSDIQQFYQNNVKNGFITDDQAAMKLSQLPPTQGMPAAQAALILKNHMGNELQTAQSTMEALNYHLGEKGQGDNGASTFSTLSSPKPGFAGNPQAGGVIQPQPGIPTQPPPTQPIVSQGAPGQPARGTPGIVGPSAPPTGLPTQPGGSILPFKPGTTPPQIMSAGGVPTTGAPTAVKTQSFTPTGLPPGAGTAMEASGQALAQARQSGASFQRDVFPLVQAIPELEKLGTKGTGPGTELRNKLKSFVLSNVPGVKESDFNGSVGDYDKATKYLTDFVNQTGSSGTNDKLAAAFAGNPSTHISNAAAVDVAKSALALRRMQHAQYLAFEQTGLPENEYSRWNATNAVVNKPVIDPATNKPAIDPSTGQPKKTNYQIDPRAFGVDLMSNAAKAKLLEQLNKSPSEKAAFEASVKVAQDSGFITPPTGTQQ